MQKFIKYALLVFLISGYSFADNDGYNDGDPDPHPMDDGSMESND